MIIFLHSVHPVTDGQDRRALHGILSSGIYKKILHPNALLTLSEYICDYAGADLARKGWQAIEKNLKTLEALQLQKHVRKLKG